MTSLQTENLHQTIGMDIYRDLTTNPKLSALHRVIWTLGLGNKKIVQEGRKQLCFRWISNV